MHAMLDEARHRVLQMQVLEIWFSLCQRHNHYLKVMTNM